MDCNNILIDKQDKSKIKSSYFDLILTRKGQVEDTDVMLSDSGKHDNQLENKILLDYTAGQFAFLILSRSIMISNVRSEIFLFHPFQKNFIMFRLAKGAFNLSGARRANVNVKSYEGQFVLHHDC